MPQDPYCYPGTNTLINKPGIRDNPQLQLHEARMVSLAIASLIEKPIIGPFNSTRLLETHRRLFGRIYPWAGEIRTGTGTMKKQRASGYVVMYGLAEHIPAALESVFTKLQSENELRGLDRDMLIKRLAYFYSELDAIHSFREGNSRTLRQFFSDLARQAGYSHDWSRHGTDENAREALYAARDQAVMRGNLSSLENIFNKVLY
jgi:cell filamentation protein